MNKKSMSIIKKGHIYTLLILAISVSLTLMSEKFLVYAAPDQTIVRTDPLVYLFDLGNGTIGTSFNVTVKVDDIEDMVSWQARMFFDPTIINVTRWYEPTWDPEYVFFGKITLPTPDPVKVKYVLVTSTNASAMVGSAPFPRPSVGNGFFGNGTLCIFQFNITAVPSPGETLSCDLDIDNPKHNFWIEAAGPGIKIPFDETTNGYYEIIPEFHPLMILPIFIVITIIAIVLAKKLSNNPRFPRYE